MTHADTPCPTAYHAIDYCVDALRAADLPASFVGECQEWSPERDLSPTLSELFSSINDASGEALALAFARVLSSHKTEAKSWLWVQDPQSLRYGGRPFLHGLPIDQRHNLIHVEARNPSDALWAMEEGVRCGALSFVIGEIAGDPKQLDFTATRRLVLASERHAVPLYLVRRGGFANLSAARLRWRVQPTVSDAHRLNTVASGRARADVELFRGRGLRPGNFTLEHGIGEHDWGSKACDSLALVPQPCDRQVESALRAAR